MDWGAWQAIHSMGSQKFRHDWETNTLTFIFMGILTCYLTAKCSLDWGQGAWSLVMWVRLVLLDFPDDLVVGSPYASAGNAGSVPTLGRPHVSCSNWAHEPQLWALMLQLQGTETARGSPISWTWGTTALWVLRKPPGSMGGWGQWCEDNAKGVTPVLHTLHARWWQRPAGWESVVQVTNQRTDTGALCQEGHSPTQRPCYLEWSEWEWTPRLEVPQFLSSCLTWARCTGPQLALSVYIASGLALGVVSRL